MFEIVVGGRGLDGAGSAGGDGGLNGGGRGAGAPPVGYCAAGGGDGGSDVRTGSCAATQSCTYADRIVVAGGGGGHAVGGFCAGDDATEISFGTSPCIPAGEEGGFGDGGQGATASGGGGGGGSGGSGGGGSGGDGSGHVDPLARTRLVQTSVQIGDGQVVISKG